MDIEGKTILVLGAGGMVGQAVCRLLIKERAGTLILTSLHEHETEQLEAVLKKENHTHLPAIEKTWGNILIRHAFKDLSREEILSDSKIRQALISDLFSPMTKETLAASEIYYLCQHYKPDIIVDTINLATGLSYQDIFAASKEALNALKKSEQEKTLNEAAVQTIEKLLLTQYTPQITRHVQIFFQAMVEAETKVYIKVGTSGSGGMGFNIPFTHSEDKPSQTLMAKSALAGAHTLLLFLMARTPGGPIIKEIKPTAAIGWKQLGFGPITRKGKPVLLEEATLSDAVPLAGKLKKILPKKPKFLKSNGEPKTLTAPFIDLGENGLYALGEFEVLTDVEQMEFITPEEIAETVVWEIKGGNTGHDIVAALDNSTMGPTYRAGYMRKQAVQRVKEIAKKTGVDSVAFELLGPPRLSKLLFESYLLKKAFGSFEAVLACDTKEISGTLEKLLLENQELRSQIISIGIPILLSRGDKLLRGSKIAIPADIPGQPDAQFEITEAGVERWAHDGWIDLREKNIERWQKRFEKILSAVETLRQEDTSSAHPKDRFYWDHGQEKTPIEIAKVVAWIISDEEQGFRMKD